MYRDEGVALRARADALAAEVAAEKRRRVAAEAARDEVLSGAPVRESPWRYPIILLPAIVAVPIMIALTLDARRNRATSDTLGARYVAQVQRADALQEQLVKAERQARRCRPIPDRLPHIQQPESRYSQRGMGPIGANAGMHRLRALRRR